MSSGNNLNADNTAPDASGSYTQPVLRQSVYATGQSNASRAYIKNRASFSTPATSYNPFAETPAQPLTGSADAAKFPQPVFDQQPDYTEGNPGHNFGQQTQRRSIGCSPFGIIGGFFRAIWNFLVLIRNALLTAFVVIILAVIGLIFILVYKPPLFWNPVKTFLNDGVTAVNKTTSEDELKAIYERINSTALNNQQVKLSDAELSAIIRSNTLLGEKCFVETTSKGMNFYINIDTPERPLWFIVRTDINSQNRIEVNSAGFGRFNTPDQISSVLNDTLGVVFQFIEDQVTADSTVTAVKQMTDSKLLDSKLNLQKVEFDDGFIVLSYQNNSETGSDFSY